MKTKKTDETAPQPPEREPTPEEKAAAEQEAIKQRFAFAHFQKARAAAKVRADARRTGRQP